MGSLSMVKMEAMYSRNGEIRPERRDMDVILIKHCRGGLGIKIVGGKSSLGTDYGIFVKKILAGGVAEIDGRLQEGDQILEANGESMLGISNDRALSILRSAAEANHAKLVISRDSQAREEFSHLMSALNGGVPLSKYSEPSSHSSMLVRSTSLGSSRGSTPSPTTMEKRSWVMSAGRMSPLALGRHGSPSLSPSNSFDKTPAGLQRMFSVDLPSVTAGATTTTPLDHRLTETVDPPAYNNSLLRLSLNENGNPTGYTRHMNGSNTHSPERSPKYKDEQQSMTSSEITVDSGLPTDRQSGNSSPIFDSSGEGHVITIPMTNGMGLCIIGGTNRPEGPHIYVEDIIEGSDAHKDGRLKHGDQLVAVNGESLVGVTHEQAKSLLTRLKLRRDIKQVEISFIRSKTAFNGHSSRVRNGDVELPNGSLHSSPPHQLSLELNGVESSDSRTASNRSSDTEPDYSNTSLFMRDLLATQSGGLSASTGLTASDSNQSSELNSSQTSPASLASPPVIVNPVQEPGASEMQSYAAHTRVPDGYMPAGGIQQPITALPPRVAGRFLPTMSSTPSTVNGGIATQLPQPPLPHHPADVPVNGLSQTPPGAFQISPVGPTYQSAFEPSSVPYYLQQDLDSLRRVTQQYGSPDQPSPQSSSAVVPGSRSSGMATRQGRQARNGRRLSLDPHTRLKVEKLEVALRYLGFQPTDAQQRELRSRLHIDHTGSVSYGDFVGAARQVFDFQLNDHKLSTSAFQFAVHDINAMQRQQFVQMQETQQNAQAQAAANQSQEDLDRLTRERDEALREVQHLRKLLKQKERECSTSEEELMKSRQDAQMLLDESRSLQNRVHLVSQAQQAARSMEQDYEEVVKLLEKELAHYKAKSEQQNHPDPKEIEELQKRLVVLGCQLRKAEVGKRTYEVATEKLIHFAELVHDVLSEGGPGMPQQRGKGEAARRDGSGNPRPPAYLARHAKYNPSSLAKEARDTVKSVKSLLEEEPLPFGWEEAYTSDGVRYYINHVTHQTSWLHPVTRVQHLPVIMEKEDSTQDNGNNVVKETRT